MSELTDKLRELHHLLQFPGSVLNDCTDEEGLDTAADYRKVDALLIECIRLSEQDGGQGDDGDGGEVDDGDAAKSGPGSPEYSSPEAGSGVLPAIPIAPPHISTLLNSQDNRATSEPLFVVFQKRRIYGMDPDYAEPIVWYHCDGIEADEEEAKSLEVKYQENFEVPPEWYRTGYIDVDVFVTACFTERGAKDYIDANGHNLKRPFIYTETLYRNREMIAVRAALRGGAQGIRAAAESGSHSDATEPAPSPTAIPIADAPNEQRSPTS